MDARDARRWRWLVGWTLLCLVAAGCGEDGVGEQDGDDGGRDGGPDAGADVDPGQVFTLHIPEGTRMCSGFMEGRDHLQELAVLSQVELRPGSLSLTREAGGLEVDNPVARVLLGPEREEISSPALRAQAEASLWDSGGGWQEWSYLVRVPLTRTQGTAELDFKLNVSTETGVWPVEITVGTEPAGVGVSAELRLDGGDDRVRELVGYAPCELAGPPVRTVHAVSAAGAAIDLELRSGGWNGACYMVGETACYFLVQAAYARGPYQADINDRWRLVYNGSHHNWMDRYLLLLDPPDGATAAVLLISPDFFTQLGAAIVYLDADFQELSREDLTTWQQGP
jgi:hypothetical protein